MIICNLVAGVTLLLIHVSGNTDGSGLSCLVSIKVPRNTLFRVPVTTVLEINCTVTIHKCQGDPKITWCKLYGNDCEALNQSNYTESTWKKITQHEGISFLTFLNISMEDAGLYRCRLQDHSSVSHTINVTVTEDNNNEESHNHTNTSNSQNSQKGLEWLWPYVYICSGLVGLVVIIMTVSLFIIRCHERKSRRKGMTAINQSMETQRRDPSTQSHPHRNTPSPSAQLTSAVFCAYDTPPVRSGSHRDRPPAGRVAANTIESKGCRNNITTGEEENPLVYASLNHKAMTKGPKRTVQHETEPSEYAAIRFR